MLANLLTNKQKLILREITKIQDFPVLEERVKSMVEEFQEFRLSMGKKVKTCIILWSLRNLDS